MRKHVNPELIGESVFGPHFVRVSARVAGASFTITSASGSDTANVDWMIVEP